MSPLVQKPAVDTLSIEEFNGTAAENGLKSVYLSYRWKVEDDLARSLLNWDYEFLPPHLREWTGEETEFQVACSGWLQTLAKSEVLELLYEHTTNLLQERVGERHLQCELLKQLETLSELALDHGWSEDFEAVFQDLKGRGIQISAEYKNLWILPKEWTFESAVGHRLLLTGVEIFDESIEGLQTALKDGRQQKAENCLAWVEEALFYLYAVEDWSISPWI